MISILADNREHASATRMNEDDPTPAASSALDPCDHLSGGEHRLGVDRRVELDRGVHPLLAEGRGRVLHQGDRIAELVPVTASPFHAPRRGQSREDDVLDAVLTKVHVEVGAGEPALPPVLARHDVTISGSEAWVPLAAPRAGLEHLPVADRPGRAARTQPPFEVPGAPAAVRGDDDLDARRTYGGQHRATVLVQADGLGDLRQPG